MEDDLTVVGIERGGEDGVATALDGDVKGGCVGGDGDGRGERGGEDEGCCPQRKKPLSYVGKAQDKGFMKKRIRRDSAYRIYFNSF